MMNEEKQIKNTQSKNTQSNKSKKQLKVRLVITLVLITLLFLAAVGRIFWIQILDGQRYKNKATAQQIKGQLIAPQRGTIYDRNGKELAVSIPVKTIAIDPVLLSKSKTSPDQIAQIFSDVLKVDKKDVLAKLKKNTVYEVIKRKVELEDSNALKKWCTDNKINGVYFEDDSKRYYPNNSLAAHVIGFTGTDNQGLSGIELSAEKYLKGIPGKIIGEVDERGWEIPFVQEKNIDVKNGLNVVLTIDEMVQYYAEKALKKTMEDFKVLNGGTVIVLDPRNGEILAMASAPDFNLNTPYAEPVGVSKLDTSNWKDLKQDEKIKKLQETVWRNKAVNESYEPGSTFKSITAAAGFEEGMISNGTEVVDAPVKVASWTINCDVPGGHGRETFSQAIYNSCNPIFVKLSQSLGIDRFYSYVKAFGFFDKTGIDLPGEATSIFQKRPTEIDMVTASFGQSFQITPIQLITAYGALANGGKLYKPHLIKELKDSNNNIVFKTQPEIVRNVISKQTSDIIKDNLVGVVDEGTGTNAYIPGYNVAGKTGTAETFENGVRSTEHFIASFSAFAPADNPVINVLVVIDYPSQKSHFGGSVAAPAAAKIIEETLNYLGVERNYTDKDRVRMKQEVNTPDITNKTLKEAINTLTGLNLKHKVIGDAGNLKALVAGQYPKPGESIIANSMIVLFTDKNNMNMTVKMPNLTGKTIYEATKVLNDLGLNIKVKGNGVSATQEYKPGTEVVIGKAVEVEFINDDVD
ncbi:MAG: penicillin-binding transpeptidase domain-containing protein [Clostridia bacterium]|nr:penicillin-binding transpeptidase domain-containing protein [Clostridia bacterium]